MAQLPENQHTTSAAIVRWYESKPQEHRPHMGASLIGHECERYVWLTWRWVLTPSFKGRILRLFDTGKREESRIVEELRGIGAQVWDTDENGNQWRVSACNGHFGGSLDGVARGLPEAPKSTCVLEFKTHSDKSFNELLKLKVQLAKPQHYDQMQVYMGLMEIDRAMYIAVNKNTDDVYCEWIHFDKDKFYVLKERARYLIEAPNPPVKLSEDPAYYVCKMCSMWAHCHGGLAAEANCRTCCHASPVENAAWQCQLHNAEITTGMQRQACSQHLMIPSLVPYGEAIDGDQTWIAYKHRTSGAHFVNGPENIKDYGPNFTSVELHRCPGALLEQVAELKNEFPGSKMVSGSVTNPNTTGFEDMPNDLDNVEIKPESPKKREARRKNEAYIQALQKMAGDK
jgi:hypothetical protein